MNKLSIAIAAAAVTAFAGHAMAANDAMSTQQKAAASNMAASGVQGTAKPDPRPAAGHTNMGKAMKGDKAAAMSGQTVEGTATPPEKTPRPAAGPTDVKKVVQGDKAAARAAQHGGTVQGEKNAKP